MAVTGRSLIFLLLYFAGLLGLANFSTFRHTNGGDWVAASALIADVAFFALVAEYQLSLKDSSPAPVKGIAWFWALTLAGRAILLWADPGDDLWRCLWEGMVQRHGINPYILAPQAESLIGLRDANWTKIAQMNVPAFYPPAKEWLLGWFAGEVSLKFAATAADLGVVASLWRIVPKARRYQVALYAWNPLILYCFAGAGNLASWMVFFLVAAAAALRRARTDAASKLGWAWLSCLLLGFAISIEIVPVVLIPIWAWLIGRRYWLLKSTLLVPILWSFVYGFPAVPVWQNVIQRTISSKR
jgi:hypothetical protein